MSECLHEKYMNKLLNTNYRGSYSLNGSTRADKAEKPTELWYLMPFLFGIVGGIVGYIGTKNDDKAMADNLLYLGILWTVIVILVCFAVYGYYLSRIPTSFIQAFGTP